MKSTRHTKLPLRKRLLFSLLIFLGLVVVTEGISWLGIAYVEEAFSLAQIHEDLKSGSQGAAEGTQIASESAVLHPFLGWVHDPGLKEGVSEFGFVETAPTIQKQTEDKLIVAVLGGSVAMNLATEGGDALKQALAEHNPDKEITIICLASSGYRQPQQLFVLNYFLALGAEFDVVVNIDGFNEVALHPSEDAFRGVFYAYPRSWDYRVRSIPDPEITPQIYELMSIEQDRQAWAVRFNKPASRYSSTLGLIWRCWDNHLKRQLVDGRDQLVQHRLKRELRYVEGGPRRRYDETDEQFSRLVDLWQRCSVQLHQICTARNIQYHHVLQPNFYFAGTKVMSENEQDLLRRPQYMQTVAQGYPRLVEAGSELKESGVRFHDLTRIFDEATETIYADNCCHFAQSGNEMLARRIAEEIVAARLTPFAEDDGRLQHPTETGN